MRNSRPFLPILLGLLSAPALGVDYWPDTFHKLAWPDAEAACALGEAEARAAVLREQQPGVQWRYSTPTVDVVDDSETRCRFVIDRKYGFYWVTHSLHSIIHLKVGQTTPGPGPDKNSGDPPDCPPLLAGNPLHVASGNKYQEEHDYLGAGAFPLHFARHYNSAGAYPERLGALWRHSYDRRLVVTGAVALALRPDGKVYRFARQGSAWAGDADVGERLENATGGWRFITRDDLTEHYDSIGRLTRLSQRNGLAQTLTYDAQGRLASVSDPDGRQLHFEYDASGRLSALTDPGGGRFGFGYDARGLLVTRTAPDARVRTYVYDNPAFPLALTGLIDEADNRFATWTYDAQGRAISSEHAGGVGRVTLGYGANATTVTDALGTTRTHGYTRLHGRFHGTAISQPCNGCGAVATTSYDANGDVASRSDFNGVTTTYTHDPLRHLQTSRTEAAGTPLARTILTQWHPQWRLPLRIEMPRQRSDFSYDAQGNLLSRTDTALDTNAARTWRYTYDPQGRRLSEDGPRSDLSDLTTYVYWPATAQCPGTGPGIASGCRGQLRRLINAAGHVTEYLAYDAHGRVLHWRDPNGVEYHASYDARGRLTGEQAGGQITTYGYDPRGLLSTLSQPDGTVLHYHYDAAQRLIGVSDGLGHRTDYTLDGAGNRILETLSAAGATVIQRIERRYDALGRLHEEHLGVR